MYYLIRKGIQKVKDNSNFNKRCQIYYFKGTWNNKKYRKMK